MVTPDASAQATLILGLDPAQAGIVRVFVAETYRLFGCEDEVAEDARLAASEAFAELTARCSSGTATVEVSAVDGKVTTRLEARSTSRGPADEDLRTDDRRRSLIAALMADVRDELDAEPPAISFSAPRPS